ncbi:hypothetical protein AAG906_012614 [Vitis piasezkii]
MRALHHPSHHGSGQHIGSEDELFVVVTYCYICIPVGFSIFFYTHSSFILSLFVCFYPRRSSFHFMNDEFFGLSHLAHMVLRYLTLRTQGFGIIYWEIWAFVSHRFIHLLPLAYITVRVVSITSGDIEGHILSFHSVYLPQVHDQR